MKRFISLLKKEIMGHFLSFAAYYIIALYVFLSIISAFYMGGYFITTDTDLYSFFHFQPQILMFVIPALAMRSWSEEKKSGTYEVLLAYPVSYLNMILAKFFASLFICFVMILLTVPLWIYSANMMNLDNSVILSAYIGCLFVAALFCSISCLISSTNSSPIISYLVSVIVIWVIVGIDYNFVVKPLIYASSVIFINIQGAFNFENHYNAFVAAQIGLDNIIYFVTFTCFALILNKIVIEDRHEKSWVSISIVGVLLTVALILISILSAMLFSTSKLDVTSDRKYSLSESTIQIIREIPEQIDIKIYISKDIRKMSPSLADYSKYVLNFIEKYRKKSNGRIAVDVRTVELYSVNEREAKENGIVSLLGNNENELIYFGAVISNSSGRSQTINIFRPERRQYLEKDISRAIYKLSQTRNKKIGWVNTLGFTFSDEILSSIIKENYDVVEVNAKELEIPNSIDVLVVVNMQNMSKFLSYATDQFLMRGKNVLSFVDNVNAQTGDKAISPYTAELLKKWGINYYSDDVVTDEQLAGRKVISDGSNKRIFNDVLTLNLGKENINQENAITRGLTNITLKTPALIEHFAIEDINMQSLLNTSKASGIVNKSVARSEDERYIQDSIEKEGISYSLALLAEGKTFSLFQNNMLAGTEFEKDMAPFLVLSIDPAKFLVVSDVDMLDEKNWIYFGDTINPYSLAVPNNNVDFVARAVDYLTGNTILLGLGSKNIILNEKSLFDKYKDKVVAANFAEIYRVGNDILKKEMETALLTEETKKSFSMEKVKQLEILSRELNELKEQNKYLNYLISNETNNSAYTITVLMSFVLPVFSTLAIFALVVMFRNRKRKKILEMLNEG